MLISLIVFDQSLSESAVNDLINKHQLKSAVNEINHSTQQDLVDGFNKTGRPASTSGYSYSSWFSWRRAASMEPTGASKVPTVSLFREKITSLMFFFFLLFLVCCF